MLVPIKNIKVGWTLHPKLPDIKTMAKIVGLFIFPTIFIVFVFMKDFISVIVGLFLIYSLYFFFLSKSISKVEDNWKTILRVFTKRFNTDLVINEEEESNYLLFNDTYVIVTKLEGKSIDILSSNDRIQEKKERMKFLVDNTYNFKTISILERNTNMDIEKSNENSINYQERLYYNESYFIQDYRIFFARGESKIREIEKFINYYRNDLSIVSKEKSLQVLSKLSDDYNLATDEYEKYDLFFMKDIDEEISAFFLYNAKKILSDTGKDFVFINDYIPYGMSEAQSHLQKSAREKKFQLSKMNDVDPDLNSELGYNERIINLAEKVYDKEERIYRFASYFLIEKGLSEDEKETLIRELYKCSSILYNEVNLIQPYIYNQRFLMNPLLTFDVQSNVLSMDFINEKCMLNDMYGKFLSESNNGNIIFNPFVQEGQRFGMSIQLLGYTGAGKSTLLKLLIHNNYENNNKTIILDIENEYSVFTKQLGGQVIDIKDMFINIMEIFINEYVLEDSKSNDKDEIWDKNLEENVERILYFFSQIISDHGMLTQLRTSLNNYYMEMYHDTKDLYASRNYTLIDFYDYIKKENSKLHPTNPVEEEKLKRSSLLELEIEALISSNRSLFNNVTDLDLSNDLICINLYELMDNEEESVIKSAMLKQLYSIIIWREMKNNRQYNELKGISRNNYMERFDDTKFLAIVVDEEHQILNDNDEAFVGKLNSYIRRANKYFTGIWGASHLLSDYNIDDGSVAAQQRESLLKLRTYKIIMKQPASEKEGYESLIKKQGNSSGLTMDHIEMSFDFMKGDYILSFADKIYSGNIIVNPELESLVYSVKDS